MTGNRSQVGSVPLVREDIRGSRGTFEMKRRAVLKALGGAAIIGGVSCGVRLKGGRSVMSVLKSAELITTDTAAVIYGRHKVPGTREVIRHDIEVYRVTYTTRDTDGVEVVASGAILVPKTRGPLRVMCYGRGTIIPGHGERFAPSYYNLENNQSISENYEMSFLAATFASAGYVVVAPDGIGYGSTKEREHPYVHAASLASTSLDMLRAAREFTRRKGLDLDPRVFITGWSEGGLSGMALHKLIEETCRDEFPIAASSLFAGAYAHTAMVDLFCNYDEDYPEHHIYYWALRSMARVYKLKRPFDRIVVPPFAAALAKDVLADAPKNPRLGLDPEFRRSVLSGSDKEMRRALEDNERYDWKPQAPVFLHHGTHDDIVPFFASQMAYEAMRARRARVKLYPYLAKDHYQPVNTYVTRSLADFAWLRN
jgi:dienelactone hydrolase